MAEPNLELGSSDKDDCLYSRIIRGKAR